MRRWCVICALLVGGRPALAGGLVVTGGTPRTIGRAGTGSVGDDGGGALLLNPAAMARRDGTRIQLGLAFVDDEIAWQTDTPGAPIARDQGSSAMAPLVAGVGSLGSWVIGAGVMTSAVSERAMRRPPPELPPEMLDEQFEFRYAGIAGAARRDTVAIGAARRLGDSVAVGLTLAASRVGVSEVRRLWAGFDGRDEVGDPQLDIEVALSGADRFAPSATAGVLIAPADTSLELGASLTIAHQLAIDADADGLGAPRPGPMVLLDRPSARLILRQPWTVRAGARYVGERFVAELNGELVAMPPGASEATWRVDGMQVVDQTGVATALARVPSRISQRSHGTLRGAVDAELIGGFLWATAGYAYTVGGTALRRASPIFGDLGGHTFALGLEGSAGGFTFTFGWSRTWAVTRHTESVLRLDNPFGAGDRTLGSGSFDGSVDQIGILLDVELSAPD